MRIATLVFVIDRSQEESLVLMGDKIGGHATIGTTNGYGGGHEPTDESLYHTSVRECLEEGRFEIEVEHLDTYGLIDFYDSLGQDDPDYRMYVHITEKWRGVPQATEEITNPTWYPLSELPFWQMMPDKRLWLGRILGGERLRGWVHYSGPDRKEVVSHHFTPLREVDLKRQ